MSRSADIGRLEVGTGPSHGVPEPSSWWWGKRYLLLALGMALSVGGTLAVPRLGGPSGQEVTAGSGTTTTEAPAEDAPAAPTAPTPDPATPSPGPGAPAERDPAPSASTTTTTVRRSTVPPTSPGASPGAAAASLPRRTPAPTMAAPAPTTPAGPPWRANPISIFAATPVVVGEPVEFGVSVRGQGDAYQVVFGDGGSAGSASTFGCDDYSTPSAYRHTFDSPGRYTFIVRIHGSGSCTTHARDFRTTSKAFTFDVIAPG